MSTLSKAERDKLPESAFGWPAKKLFVIQDQDDLASAARLLPKVPPAERDAVKGRVLGIAKRLGLTPPKAWTEDASMSEAVVEFATDSEGQVDGDHVIRTAKVIFRAGPYDFPADKGGPFEMSPEDVMAFCQDFQPVELEDTHVPSIFNGKLGHFIEPLPAADFSEFGGKVRIPGWLHKLFPGQPIPLSAKWDRSTKTMKKLALVPNPRIDNAAMFAAFAAAEETTDTGMHKTPHGQKMVQYIHDLTAHGGATCSPDHSPGMKEASFHADHEASTIQKIHDMTLGSGAACALYRDNQTRTAAQLGNLSRTTVEALPAYRDYQPGSYALMSDADAPAREKKPEPTAREKELEAQLAAERRKHAAREAVTFAEQAKAGNHIYPVQFADTVSGYLQEAEDDINFGGEVTFADESNQTRRGSRVDAYRARILKTPAHVLTQELVPGEAAALFNRERAQTPVEKDLEEAQQQATAYAQRYNRNGKTK
jgi:hypothetical protein